MMSTQLITRDQLMRLILDLPQDHLPVAYEHLLRLDEYTAHRALSEDERCKQAQEALISAYDATLEAWARAQEIRDGQTGQHCTRVAGLTVELSRAIGLPESRLVHIRRGAILHDIGKIGVPENILRKPGPLTAEEWKLMREHPTFAYEILQPIEFLRPAIDIPYCHHEWLDGTGYPRGLKGDDIPIAARIFAVVDVWDTMRADRLYRKAASSDIARQYLHEQSGKQFDRSIVDGFLGMEIDEG